MRVRTPETPHEPASWRTGHPVATSKTTRETGQKFRLILIWLTAKTSRNKGCLSPRIRIRPVSPPASYYPSFRRLYIQVNVRSIQYLARQRSECGSQHLFISKPWDRMTVPHCPLDSERSDEWPRRRLSKNHGTPYSRDCLTGAVYKHRDTNTWRQPTGTHRCDSKLPMATTWINVLSLTRYRDRVNDNLCVQPRHLGIHCDSSKQVCLRAAGPVSISHQGRRDLSNVINKHWS